MTREEIIQAISDDKMMPFIQQEQLAEIVDFVIKNYNPSLPSNLDEAAYKYADDSCFDDPEFTATKLAFIAGAEWMAKQDQKDHELTIKDLKLLHTFLYAVKNNKQGMFTFTRLSDEEYQEVLKRFKEIKK